MDKLHLINALGDYQIGQVSSFPNLDNTATYLRKLCLSESEFMAHVFLKQVKETNSLSLCKS